MRRFPTSPSLLEPVRLLTRVLPPCVCLARLGHVFVCFGLLEIQRKYVVFPKEDVRPPVGGLDELKAFQQDRKLEQQPPPANAE